MTDSEKIKKINDIIEGDVGDCDKETLKDMIYSIKLIIAKNHDNLYKRAVKIEDLPPDDDWIQDDVWDEIYQQEVIKKKE